MARFTATIFDINLMSISEVSNDSLTALTAMIHSDIKRKGCDVSIFDMVSNKYIMYNSTWRDNQ